MKKFVALILASLFAFSFMGCAGISDQEMNKDQDKTVVEENSNDVSSEETSKVPEVPEVPVVVNDFTVLLKSGDTSTEPYQKFVGSQSWTDFGWLCSDGCGVSIPSVYNDVPQVTYSDDLQIVYGDKTTLIQLSVYASDFSLINGSSDQEELSSLPEGEYYLLFFVKENGRYIESEEESEWTCYDCVYKLVVPNT